MFKSPERYQPKKLEEEEEGKKLKENQKESVEPKELTEQEMNYIDKNTRIRTEYSKGIHGKLTTAEARRFFESILLEDVLTTAWAAANGREIETIESGGKIYDADDEDNKRKKRVMEAVLSDMEAELEEKFSDIKEKVWALDEEVRRLSEDEEEKREREEEKNKILLLERKFREEFKNAMESEEKRKEAMEGY